MIIKCETCGADPCARWREPPAMIFAEGAGSNRRYFCRDHLPGEKKKQIEAREKALGLPIGGLR
jgi:hypothetical protein